MPVVPNIFLKLIVYQQYSGYSHNTIKSQHIAIGTFHKLHDYSDPTKTFSIARILKGVRKTKPDKKVLAPITLPILTNLLDITIYLGLANYDSTRLKALFLVACHGCFRVGEWLKSNNPQHAIFSLISNTYAKLIRSPFVWILTNTH